MMPNGKVLFYHFLYFSHKKSQIKRKFIKVIEVEGVGISNLEIIVFVRKLDIYFKLHEFLSSVSFKFLLAYDFTYYDFSFEFGNAKRQNCLYNI